LDLNRFKKKPVMGILRGIDTEIVEPLFETIVSSGLETVEVAMNTPKASEIIRKAVDGFGDKLMIGAGTVVNMDLLKDALDAGATYIVTPTNEPDVTKSCVDNNIPIFPGAFTPQEIFNAWNAGATMVKVFPAKFLGPGYIKEVKGPFNELELLACGGVSTETIKEYFDCGAGAVAFGGSIFKKEWLDKRDFESIKLSIENLLSRL
jgi:2-dehydro-3-deoxyphosphogluconate aldolase/(4S)-4-hydroxy-2-oxoglutarate aldolase